MNLDAVSHSLGAIFEWAWRTSLHASVLIVLVCLIQLAGGKWLAPRWRYALGVLVLVRLLMPAVPASAFSIFNLSKRVWPAAPQTEMNVVPPSSMPTRLIPAVSYESVASLRADVRAEQKTDWLKAVQVLWLL